MAKKKIEEDIETSDEVSVETLEVGKPVCIHQNQGEGKCFDCNQTI